MAARFDNVGAKRAETTAAKAIQSLEARASEKAPAGKGARKTARVQLLLAPDILAAADEAARKDGRSRNSWIGKAITEKLERDE